MSSSISNCVKIKVDHNRVLHYKVDLCVVKFFIKTILRLLNRIISCNRSIGSFHATGRRDCVSYVDQWSSWSQI